MRAAAHIEEMGGNRHRIVVTEIPFQVNKSALIERIADLVREGRIDTISDLRDESDRRGMSIVDRAQARRPAAQGAQPALQIHRPAEHLRGAAPGAGGGRERPQRAAPAVAQARAANLHRAPARWSSRAAPSTTWRKRSRARAHPGGPAHRPGQPGRGDQAPSANRDDADAANSEPDEPLQADRDLQAQAILDMQLRRLAALERQKIQDEHAELLKTIAYFEDLLANPKQDPGADPGRHGRPGEEVWRRAPHAHRRWTRPRTCATKTWCPTRPC